MEEISFEKISPCRPDGTQPFGPLSCFFWTSDLALYLYDPRVHHMHHTNAVRLAKQIQRGEPTQIGFVSPIVSACLAAQRSRPGTYGTVKFAGDAEAYADYVGLRDVLEGRQPNHTHGAQHGRTYSPLECLSLQEHVNRCNQTITEVIRRKLTPQQFDNVGGEIASSIGELHDNVASHSDGQGYSAAQVYKAGKPDGFVSYAIADNGRGFLSNARGADTSVTTHHDAVKWAFRRGTTSAVEPDWWSIKGQRGISADDYDASHGPGLVHAGMGLANLAELVLQADGTLWVCSGDASLVYQNGTWRTHDTDFSWPGVMIELKIPLTARVRTPPPFTSGQEKSDINDLL